MSVMPLLVALMGTVGVLAALVIGWYIGRKPVAALQDEVHFYQSERQKSQVEQVRLSERLAGVQQSNEQQIKWLEQQCTDTAQQVHSLQSLVQELQRKLATEQEARTQEQKNADEKLTLLTENKAQLVQEFQNLSQKIYEEKQKQFAEQSQTGLNSLLTPFKDQLEGLRKRVDEVHTAETRDRVELRTQIESLQKLNQQITEEAKALTTALRGENKIQGNWGEMILETVLERSGLRKDIEYVREQVLRDDDGKIYRPDVVINLPEGKHLIIDSKVSLNAYTDYVNAITDEEREAAARRHVESVRGHIIGLSEKAYQKLVNVQSPNFVFLFMPIESAFMLAFQRDEKLFEMAFDKRIVVVTPTTLLATLRTVNSLWTLERRSRSTEKLAEQAAKVYEKLVTVVERFDKVGTQLNTVQKTYGEVWEALKTGRGNLLSQSEKFLQLGVRVKKELSRDLAQEALEQDGQFTEDE